MREDLARIVLANITPAGNYAGDLAVKTRSRIEDVYDCISYLVKKGLVVGNGDGFGVLYALTSEGLKEQRQHP